MAGRKKQLVSRDINGKHSFPGANRKNSPENPAAQNLPEESNPYRLKIQAVDDLVHASPENSPPVSRQELRKFQSGPRITLADWVKAILIKWWIAGTICYFFIWGLSAVSINPWDHLVILGIALGGITHLITNNILRFIAKKKGAYDRWMMFPKKSLLYLPADLIYALALMALTIMTYNGINLQAGRVVLGVEPLLFGLIVTGWDLLMLGAKSLLKRILRDAKNNVSRQQ